MPVEPPRTRWQLPSPDQADEADLIAVGADLLPGTLLAAYRTGMFPMGVGDDGTPPIGWWSPVRRGVLLRGDHHVSRSLRRSRRRYTVGFDDDFDAVVAACADPGRDGRWITSDIAAAYRTLFNLGWAHSVEVRNGAGDLVGGLYGVAIGGLFAGESMFHRETDAGKVAVWAMADVVFADEDPDRIIDVQWSTDHLASLGVREIPRSEYLRRLSRATRLTTPAGWCERMASSRPVLVPDNEIDRNQGRAPTT